MHIKTLQYTFNRCVRHLLKQKKQSLDSQKKLCSLRGAKGTMCAIGCFIPNKDYRPEMEDSVILYNGVKGMTGAYLYSRGYNLEFLEELRNIHDGYNPKEWKKMFYSLADKYKLKKDVLV